MKRIAQNGYIAEELADDLERVHETTDPSAIDSDDLKPAIATALETTDEETVTITDITPTDNAARPSSILLADFTVDGDSLVAEIQCTETMTFADEDAVEHHGDGSMSFPVSAVGTPDNNYETLEVIIYEE